MGEMAGIDAKPPSHHYAAYDNLVDLDLSDLMTRTSFSHPTLHAWPPSVSQLEAYRAQQHEPDIHSLLKLEAPGDASFEILPPSQAHVLPCNTQLQLSDFELGPAWGLPVYTYPALISNGLEHIPDTTSFPLFPHTTQPASVPRSACHYFEDGSIRSPWPLSPDYAHCGPLPTVEHDEDAIDDKPYARLIYEALMQAPGHRMMLREIYEWFRHNTTKPQESGSNGWQNSIRHNLSMNKAFENDRDSVRGSSRKATSVWVLTKDAIDNGVQSTTRYRKTGAGKRPLGGRMPAIQRQRAGARGGRAARNSVKRRQQDHSAFTDPTSTASPSTTSYSDYSDYPRFDYHELQPAARSWPMTPAEDNLAADENNLFNSLTPQSKLELSPQNLAYGEENMHMQNVLLQSMRDQHVGESVRFHAE
ncbi:hypothetical protein PV04_02683 [Phialophora macrospora]|uniref:Forkhead box protein O n=1 Tax=Phialophora macrospora TaxID=1851006 RepID=A0A0D2CYX7_9EURO|nr:hypothetical protein PV04_02683 [Phialophora macrospora]